MAQANEGTPLAEEERLWTHERKVIVFLNCFNRFMMMAYYTTITPLLPLYARKLGFGDVGQGIILASLQAGWFLGLPLVNKVVVRPCQLVRWGACAYLLAPTIVVWHQSVYTIVIGRVIEGLGSCLLMILMKSVMAREIPEGIKGTAFGLGHFFGSMGLFIGPIAGGYLYPYGGLRLPMLMLMILGAIGLTVYLTLVPERWFDTYEARIAAAEAAGVSMFERFSTVLQEHRLRSLLIVHFCSWFILGMIFMAIPEYMVESLKFGAMMAASIWVLFDLSSMLGSLVGGHLADALPSWNVFFVGFALQHVMQVLLVLLTFQATPSVSGFVLCTSIIFAFGTTESGALGPAYMKMLTSYEQQSARDAKTADRFEEILSLMELTCSVAMTLGPLYAGMMCSMHGFSITILIALVFTGVIATFSALATNGLFVEEDNFGDDPMPEAPFSRQCSPGVHLMFAKQNTASRQTTLDGPP